jgi:hypothetical protein
LALKIAHVNNTAGIASIMSAEQEKMGHTSTIYVFDRTTYHLFGGKKIDYKFPISKWMFFNSLKKYDIWHYHYPYGKLKVELEKRKRGRVLIKHYHGDDLRGREELDHCFVSTPDLVKWAPNATWLPNPINIDEIELRYPNKERILKQKEGTLLKVGYYPFFKYYPGQDFIRKALFDLSEKKKIIPVEIFDLNHSDALIRINECDIIVGKILPDIGWYGQFEVESIVLRKPVMCYISDELYCRYTPPVYRTSKDTFGADLVGLIEDVDTRETLALEGINYIKKYHDIGKVMSMVQESYARYSQ